ncbi:MAG: phosphoglucomutase/phosphomannomutase family protein [Nitrospirota bacterium]
MSRIKFGTSGWRAKIADEFTFANVRLVVQSIADYIDSKRLKEKGVIVGYDTRFLSEKFAEEASSIIAGNGIKGYFSLRDVPTPVLSYEILRRKTAGAINFTASHNPPEYGGIKFSPDWGGPALPEVTGYIEERINTISINNIATLPLHEARNRGLLENIDMRMPYLTDLKEKIDLSAIKKSKLKIAVDLLYGTARDYLDTILRENGCEISVLHGYRDPYFGGMTPDPSEKNLSELRGFVKKGDYDLGLATDGDADRFGIIDKDGIFIEPNYIIALLMDYFVRERGWKGDVARTVATTHLVDSVARYHGRYVHETPVGFKYIGDLISKDKLIIGGEESAGLSIKGHIPEKDGILACLLVAEMVAIEGKTISQILNDLYRKIGKIVTKRINITLTEGMKNTLEERLKDVPPFFDGLRVREVVKIDGIKYILEDNSWILIRTSGTEPVVRIYAEAGDENRLEVLLNAGKRFIMGG